MRQRTRLVLALALAGALVLAGCGGNGSTTTTADGTPGTATTGPATATDAPGYDQPGDALDADQLRANARAVDSYTGTFGVTWTINGSETDVLDLRIAVDRVAERGRLEATTRLGGVTRVERYTAGDTTYVRTNRSGSVSYASETEPYEAVQPVNITAGPTSSGGDGSLVAALNWERVGTETFDGTTVTRYESTGVADRSRLPAAFAGQADVRNVSATILIDGEGRLRSYTFEYVLVGDGGQTVAATQTFTVTAVDETSVTEPDWIDEA